MRTGMIGGGDSITNGQGHEGHDFLRALSDFRVVDLSHPVSPLMPRWPGDPVTLFDAWSDMDRDGYLLRRFSMSEHGGTHMTASATFFKAGRSIDRYSTSELVRPAVVIDTRERCRTNRDYALSPADVLDWEAHHGKMPAGAVALMLTGWSKQWGDPEDFLGKDSKGTLHFPGFGIDAARLLVNERKAAGLGTDTAGVEPGVEETFPVSRLVLAQPRIVLENLTNLDSLPATGAVISIGVLKLEGGSGSPAAVTAFLRRRDE